MSQYPLDYYNLSTGICLTASCIQTSAGILSSLKMNIDPCSDFYQFTCGNWIQEIIIPEDLTDFNILDVATYQHKERLRAILDGSYHDLLKATISPSSYGLHTDANKQTDRKIFKIVQEYFQSCVDLSTTALDPWLQDLKILSQTSNQFYLKKELIEVIGEPIYAAENLQIDLGGLLSLELNPFQRILMIGPPKEFFSFERDTQRKVLFSLLGTQNATRRDQERLILMENYSINPIPASQLYDILHRAQSAQKKLRTLAESGQDVYDTFTWHEIQQKIPWIDWSSLPLEHTVPIQLYHPDYFEYLYLYRNNQDPTRPVHTQALYDYILLGHALKKAAMIDSELRQSVPNSIYQTRASLCVEKVMERFGLVAGRIYAMIAFGGEKDKVRLERMAEGIKAAMSRRIQNATWLDSMTQTSALKKLKNMATSIGYSTFFPNQQSPQDTLDFLKGLKTDHPTFYENDRALARWRLDTYWQTFQQPINATTWIGVTTPQVVNAFNLLSQNSIFVSAGFAQPPNYDSHYPDYLNYGGIGQSMGHEYSHGFDDLGAQYDESGVERNWWSKRTHILYEKKAQCFVDTYSKAFVKDRKGKNHFIDGTLTLGESIADHEGLSAAYDAYQASKSSPNAYNPILPGLQQYSPDALFFINAARSFCSKSSLDANQDWLLDEHAPDSVRLNMMLRNSPEFSKVFQCPLGSPMNPREIKCHIW